jgi:predicted TIM-barrel fold metal-dependent hydrolase
MNNIVKGAPDMSHGKVDIHIHIVGTGGSGSGCVMSETFASGGAYSTILDSLNGGSLGRNAAAVEDLLLDTIDSSEKLDRCVVLAMDGVYKNSRLIEAETHLMTPNDYVASITREKKRLLFGASVHPYRDREEMLRETERCLDGGAVLFNWVPSVQQLDPEDERCIPFYIRLAQEGVPLLCHTGTDFLAAPVDERAAGYGRAGKLTTALDIGVKVIASHCGPAFLAAGEPATDSCVDELIEMLKTADEKKWDLSADISCFLKRDGLSCLKRIKREIDEGNISADRLIYGSDFPVSFEPREALVPAHVERSYLGARRNPLDERYELARNLGIPDSVFTNAWRVLRPLSA